VRLDRFRVYAAKKWIAGAADFVASDAVAAKKFNEEASGCSVHDVGDEAEFSFAQAIPIDKFF
jgi:hypothetical protein